MPRLRFTADPKLPRDLAHLGYRKDDEVELSDDQANRWLRRGVAVIVPPEPKAERKTRTVPPDQARAEVGRRPLPSAVVITTEPSPAAAATATENQGESEE